MSRLTLVTGATGFLGATLVRRLVQDGESVRVLRRPTSTLDLLGDASESVEHALGDVTEAASVRAAMEGVTHVYHAAAYVSFGGEDDRTMLMAVNVGGTAQVVDAANEAGVERLVHISSVAALGRTLEPQGEIDETAVWKPSKANTAYAVSKYEAEREVQRAIAEGLDAVLVNPALIFGPGRPGENTMEIAEKLCARKLPAMPSGGNGVVDVADVADGAIRAMQRGRTGERYILSGHNLKWTEILGTLSEVLGVDSPAFTLPRAPAMVFAVLSEALSTITRKRPLITRETARTASATHRYSNQKAVEELGWTPRPFRETAERVAAADPCGA